MSTDPLTWLGEVLDAMTPGSVRVNDTDAPNYWIEQERFVVADFWEDHVHDPEANAKGFAALRNLAPTMLAVVEAAHRFRSMVHVELHNLDDLNELGSRAEALDNAIAACLAAVREEQQRHEDR